MKTYNLKYNIGRAKYIINYHDGEKMHPDGSQFFDIEIFKNKIDFKKCEKKLIENGYVYNY